MSLPGQVDVLIIGAGPTGLACACSLIANGIKNIAIVDKRGEKNQAYSRALVVHAKTLEVLDRIDVGYRVMSAGSPCYTMGMHSLASGRLITYDASSLPSKYNFITVLPQSETEQVIHQRLQELGMDVHWSTKALSVREDKAGEWKVVTFDSGEEVRARYVVGADGGHSLVREATGIASIDPFASSGKSVKPADLDHPSLADEVFCLADVRVAYPDAATAAAAPEKTNLLHQEGVNMYLTPDGPGLWVRMPDNVYRLGGQIMSGSAPEKPTKEYMQKIMDTRLPSAGLQITEMIWNSRFYVKFRLAEKYWNEHVQGATVQDVDTKGGLVLVGDAAHVHPPMGGQGMNLGLRDAVNLGKALSTCLSPATTPTAARDLLTRWSSDRHAAAERVMKLAHGITAIGVSSVGMVVWVRDWAMWLVGCVPWVTNKAVYMLSGLGEKDMEY